MAKKTKKKKLIETLTHNDASRKNIPTAEYQSVMNKEDLTPIQVAYQRRNRDLDPQLVWRGKDEQDWSDLVVPAPPLYIQEKVHPKVLIDDLKKQTEEAEKGQAGFQMDLFADFNGLPDSDAKTEFYQHDANWTNRMILGDSLQVMASLAEREGLQGKVQCIYLDPPYGIKFNSNFQWSTTSRDIKDGKMDHITREPEQVKAFRDTWRDGIHSYLTYLRDRLTVARDLLTESGSIFVQISDENVHLVRCLMEEVFGSDNFVSLISFRRKINAMNPKYLGVVNDYIIYFAKNINNLKFKKLFKEQEKVLGGTWNYIKMPNGETRRIAGKEIINPKLLPENCRVFASYKLAPAGFNQNATFDVEYNGKRYNPPLTSGGRSWKTNKIGMKRLIYSNKVIPQGDTLRFRAFADDFPYNEIDHSWENAAFSSHKQYVVETAEETIKRCIIMATAPGDLVLDPTCGSGTTAYVAEQWGRRWITIDTSRVSLALARARIMGAKYPYYLLADSKEGQQKESEVTQTAPSSAPVYGNVRHGFVYERVPHVTLKSIANNSEIDVIWEKYQLILGPIREKLNKELKKKWQEWEIPCETENAWCKEAKDLHEKWWKNRIGYQKEIDASIVAKADFEYLYDNPYEDKSKVRVAGPFTVESLSPHRVLTVDEQDDLVDEKSLYKRTEDETDFAQMIMDNLKMAGVQQAHKEDKIEFSSIGGWPGHFICAEGRYDDGNENNQVEKRAGIFIGPEFGTVSRADLVAAAREAGDADFDVLIACAFNYEAHATEFDKLGRVPVLKAHMNADLHMADDLKNTGKGNLFVVFGEPDIDIIDAEDKQIQVKVNGVDVFHPNTGEVRSDSADGIACWFIDTDYNEESFFVRQAYFLGASDPYKSLKTTLKAEINKEAWETLHSDISRPFKKPESGRIAVKVINHLGDEVMKVFQVN